MARQRQHSRNSHAKRVANGQPHGKRPSELRTPAIMLMGGKCIDCGCDDVPTLQFYHYPPLRRRTNKLPDNFDQGVRLYRRIISGKRDGVVLLCANCVVKHKQADADVPSSLAANPMVVCQVASKVFETVRDLTPRANANSNGIRYRKRRLTKRLETFKVQNAPNTI
jgi:hypothetical protein